MLFMTSSCNQTTPTARAMLANQQHFGGFFTASRQNELAVSLWENWGLDNGAFSNQPIEAFCNRLTAYVPYRDTCRFVIVPDVPFDWNATIERFHEWHSMLRTLRFPLGLAVQDGATVNNIPWRLIDAICIGGSTEWKRAEWNSPLFPNDRSPVERIVLAAKLRGKWVHMLRQANSKKQLLQAYRIGANSVDGTHETKGSRKDRYEAFLWISQEMWRINNVHHSISNRHYRGESVSNTIRN